MNDPRYQYRVSWSDEDGAWIGVCNGFLLVSHIAPTQAECLRGIRALVDVIATDLHATGEPLPRPVPWAAFEAMRLDASVGSAG
ncbi:hypothetical protein [Candidatus Poriferisodalis sp.]|uniref:hypothetical protein n=1 Tax=Candidatus Poriferisodalis sp. TaxID=3101277 RepID=UPI003B01D6F5